MVKYILTTGLKLMIFAGISVTVLAFVYAATSGEIEKQERLAKEASQKELFGDVNFEKKEKNGNEVIEAIDNGATIGYIINIKTGGYAGTIDMLVGIKNNDDMALAGYVIISHSETPGFGAKAAEDKWRSNFEGVKEADLPEGKSDFRGNLGFDAITGSTITSMAIVTGIKQAYTVLENYLK